MYRNHDAVGRWIGLDRWAVRSRGEEISPKERAKPIIRNPDRTRIHDDKD
jgi:hypothetical protein